MLGGYMRIIADLFGNEAMETHPERLHPLAYGACQFKTEFKDHLNPVLDQYSK